MAFTSCVAQRCFRWTPREEQRKGKELRIEPRKKIANSIPLPVFVAIMSLASRWLASIPPSALSGALVSGSFFLFLDSILTANREENPADHFTFVMAIPFIFSVISFVVINFTEPSNFHELTGSAAKARAFLFFGWMTSLGASVGSLAVCGTHFVGEGTREHVSPAVSLVGASCLLPLAAVSLWWSKGTVSASEEYVW